MTVQTQLKKEAKCKVRRGPERSCREIHHRCVAPVMGMTFKNQSAARLVRPFLSFCQARQNA
jgi:hypothetical protein